MGIHLKSGTYRMQCVKESTTIVAKLKKEYAENNGLGLISDVVYVGKLSDDITKFIVINSDLKMPVHMIDIFDRSIKEEVTTKTIIHDSPYKFNKS